MKRNLLRLILFALTGAFILSLFSIFQKIILNADPFALKGFVVPVLFGSFVGFIIGFYYYRIQKLIIEIKKSEENLRVILNSIGDGVIATDINGKITGMNPQAEFLVGWSFVEAENRYIEDVFVIYNKSSKEKVINPVREALQTRNITYLSNNTVLVKKDKMEIDIAGSVAPIKNNNGIIVGVVLIFRDITEKYRLQRKLEQQQKLETLGQMAGGIAHDFNNLLAAIMGFAEVLSLINENSEKNLKYIKLILDTAERGADLTQNLLSFARKSDFLPRIINIHEVLEKSIQILQHTDNKNISIISEFNAIYTHVLGDISQLQNAFINLGKNAIDAMNNKGKIIFHTENIVLDEKFCSECSFNLLPGNYLEISIIDDGKGMEQEIIDKIFEPFFTTKAVGKGTGLGLSSVHGTVLSHQGAVKVTSQKNVGTKFIIYLPLVDKSKALDTKEDIDKHAKDINTSKGTIGILIIDDEELITLSLAKQLTALGQKTYFANNCEKGLELFKKHKSEIKLILLDMVMPVMSGKECFYHLHEIDPSVKIVICSGYTREQSLTDLHEKGLYGFLKKPYRLSELKKIINSIIKL